MSEFVILNNQAHQNLKVITQCKAEYGDAQMAVSLTVGELREAQRDYPIVFHQDPSSKQVYPMALLGFEKQENLFLDNTDWRDDCYIPAIIKRGPFRIGRQEKSSGEDELIVSLDVQDPRVNSEAGSALFLPHGGNSDYTDSISNTLFRLASERQPTDHFCNQLIEAQLLEELSVEVPLDGENSLKLTGFYCINEEKLASVDGETLAKWNQSGFLQAAYFCTASFASFPRLVALKQAKMNQNAA